MTRNRGKLSVLSKSCLFLAALTVCFWAISAHMMQGFGLRFRPRTELYLSSAVLLLLAAGVLFSLLEDMAGRLKPLPAAVKFFLLILTPYAFFFLFLFTADLDAGPVEYHGNSYLMVNRSFFTRESYEYYGYVNEFVMGNELLMYWYDWESPHSSLLFPIFPECCLFDPSCEFIAIPVTDGVRNPIAVV